MKMIALAVFVLIWLVIASIPRGPEKKDEGSWYADLGAPLASHQPVVVQKPLNPPSVAVAQRATPTATAIGSPLICKRTGEPSRSLVLERKKQGYELVYITPEGSDAIARSQSSAKPCERVLTRVTRKLQAAGYQCSVRTGSG